MAASSCESSLAPIDFQIDSSCESSEEIRVAVERCPLCMSTKRPFYCTVCVNDGVFEHSTSQFPERFTQKKEKWDLQEKEKFKLQERIEKSVRAQHNKAKKQAEIDECRRKVDMLKCYISTLKTHAQQDKKRIEKAKNENALKRRNTARHGDKMAKIKMFIDSITSIAVKRDSDRTAVQNSLAEKRRFLVDVLVQFIFPIEEIQPRSETESINLSTESALQEACHTTFVHGHWVYTDMVGDTGHRIVEHATLPGNGDYTAYNIWAAENRENGSAPEHESGQRNAGHTISAALCYTAQLVSVLIYILDVSLPRKLCYSEFCLDDLTEKQLSSAVSRLNHNILHLCFSQNVSPRHLVPRHSLHNIMVLLRSSELGRLHAFEVNETLIQSITDGSLSSESDDEHMITEDELDLDWERVASDYPMSTVYTVAHSGFVNTTTTHSNSEGLITSAAASVASFWRAATSHFERR
ncbi:beclin 1-associated autophagy-related key regulator-like [Gigantopelta aegis]|uniref:beclin 1-associated autophagy-related key regulator-like n=1 Tax=Gigantopelta aegis TaxID=1735272 RepID=UPI001B88A5ED|nr:beclin 1-associated autophagy-related key regulator-like [Gigantopelta aegis]